MEITTNYIFWVTIPLSMKCVSIGFSASILLSDFFKSIGLNLILFWLSLLVSSVENVGLTLIELTDPVKRKLKLWFSFKYLIALVLKSSKNSFIPMQGSLHCYKLAIAVPWHVEAESGWAFWLPNIPQLLSKILLKTVQGLSRNLRERLRKVVFVEIC